MEKFLKENKKIKNLFLSSFFYLFLFINLQFLISKVSAKDEINLFVEKLNDKLIKEFEIKYEKKKFKIAFNETVIKFNPLKAEEIEEIKNYTIIYSNITIEMFFKFSIIPLIDEPFMANKLRLDGKLGYAKIDLRYLILTELANRRYFDFVQDIPTIEYNLDDIDSFVYFNEVIESESVFGHLLGDIWNTHLSNVTYFYPSPQCLIGFNFIIELLTHYQVFYFKIKMDEETITEIMKVKSISFKEFKKINYYIGEFETVEFELEYLGSVHKNVFKVANLNLIHKTLILSGSQTGDLIDDYVTQKAADIGIELYNEYFEV